MRITTPLGWENFTPLQKQEWWQEHVVKPEMEFREIVKARHKGKLPPVILSRAEKYPEKKSPAQQLAEVQAVFRKRTAVYQPKRKTPKPRI